MIYTVYCFYVMSFLIMTECHHVSWKENMRMVKDFPCTARPRSVSVSELIEKKTGYTGVVIPAHAVVFRCDDSTGCCKDVKKTCIAVAEDHVHLQFFLPEKRAFYTLHMKNHTSCGCDYAHTRIK